MLLLMISSFVFLEALIIHPVSVRSPLEPLNWPGKKSNFQNISGVRPRSKFSTGETTKFTGMIQKSSQASWQIKLHLLKSITLLTQKQKWLRNREPRNMVRSLSPTERLVGIEPRIFWFKASNANLDKHLEYKPWSTNFQVEITKKHLDLQTYQQLCRIFIGKMGVYFSELRVLRFNEKVAFFFKTNPK